MNGASFDTPRGAKALRLSVRDSAYTDSVAQWATTWLEVPCIMGSTPSEVENYEGTDCADLLIGAHNKAHPQQTFAFAYADAIAKSDTLTEPGSEGTEGELIFWDYHGPNEEGPPDGVYDHSMICMGGEQAVWASAGWWSGYTQTGATRRCVILDNYVVWRTYVDSLNFWGPSAPPLWRRFR